MKKSNRLYFRFLVFFYMFILQTPLSNIIPILKYMDELVALLALPLFLLKLKQNKFLLIYRKKESYFIFLVIFSIVGLIGNLRYHYQPMGMVALPAWFLSIKFWLVIYTSKVLVGQLDLRRYAKRIFFHIKGIVVLFTTLTLLNYVIDLFPADIRYGLKSTQLFYGTPTGFAAVCVFLFAIVMLISSYIKGTAKWSVAILILMCSTLRSKTFTAAIAFLGIYYFVNICKKKIGFMKLLLFIPIAIAVTWNKIEYYFFSYIQYDSARYRLLVTSIAIVKDAFPIGTGFGTLGSHLSAKYYSPVYEKYGISKVHGLVEGAAYFASDNFWPMIAAETGLIGAISMVLVIYIMIKKIQKVKSVDISLYASGMVCISYLLISSMAEAAFVSQTAIPLAFVLGIIYKKREKRIHYTKNRH